LIRNYDIFNNKLKNNLSNENLSNENKTKQNHSKTVFDPNSNPIIKNSNDNINNEFDLVLAQYINEVTSFIRKIRVLCELSKDFKSLKINNSKKYMKTDEDQFNIFEFFDLFNRKTEIMLSDIIYLLNNIAMNIVKFNSLIVKSKFIEDLFYIADFNKSQKLIKNILVLIDELYSNSSTQNEYILIINNYPKFKDLLSEVILNYKTYEIDSVKFALIFIRELLNHIKNLPLHNPYCELKTYFEINNVCLVIDELTLHADTNITNYALLIEKENWSVLDIYACQNNANMKDDF
jgi:hypothetical protein